MNPRILSRVEEYVLESSRWNESLMWVFRNDGRSSRKNIFRAIASSMPIPHVRLRESLTFDDEATRRTNLLPFDFFFTFLTHEGKALKRCSRRLSKFVFTISTISRTELIHTSIRIGVVIGPFISISSLFGSGCRYTRIEPAQS